MYYMLAISFFMLKAVYHLIKEDYAASDRSIIMALIIGAISNGAT